MEDNLKAWRANRTLAWLYGFGAVAMAAYLYTDLGNLAAQLTFLTPRRAHAALLILPVLSGIHGMLASGARLYQSWARTGSMVMGVLELFAFPIGTVLGAWLIFICRQPWPDRRVNLRAEGWKGPERRR